MNLTDLMKRRRDLVGQIEHLQQQVGMLDEMIGTSFQNIAEVFGSPSEKQVAPHAVFAANRWIEPDLKENRRIAPLVMHMLRAHGRPMKTREIYEQLERSGVVVNGKNPLNTLSAHLSSLAGVESTSEGWRLS